MLKIAHIFPKRDFFSKRESLEEPVNAFFEKANAEGWEIVKTLYAYGRDGGTINAALIEYVVPDHPNNTVAGEKPTETSGKRSKWKSGREVEP